MTDLLTTRQVQSLLQVDRTTIYRMVESGQLPAVRVGKQWRFARSEVERWLAANYRPAAAAAEDPLRARGQGAGLLGPTEQPDASRELPALLPGACAQSIQDAFAELLGVTMVITDMEGRPVTRISNPCGFFEVLLNGRQDGLQHCIRTWQAMAGNVVLEPRFAPSEMGLLCARGLIRVGATLRGMVVIGGIAPEQWPPSAEQAGTLADQFGVNPSAIVANSDAVFRLDRAGQDHALRFVQRVADIFAQMIRDRQEMAAGHPE